MALDAQQLTEVAQIVLRAVTLRDAVGEVKHRFPWLRASSVDALDMRGETPVLRVGDRDLYLMKSDGHCWSVTADQGSAQGVVLTQHL